MVKPDVGILGLGRSGEGCHLFNFHLLIPSHFHVRMLLFASTHRHKDQCLFQLLWEATKQWCLSQQGTKNIILSTLGLEIWTIQCDAHILSVWSQLRFFLFQKVSP